MNRAASATQTQTSGLQALIALGLGLVIVFIAERVIGDAGLGATVRWIGVLGVVVALAMKVRDWSKASGAQRKVELLLLVAYGGVVDALIIYALSTRPGLDLLGLAGAEGDRIAQLLTVAWLAVLSVAMFAAIFMELAYARMPITAAVEVRRLRAAAEGGLSLGLALVFVFSLNYAVSKRDIRRDLSYFKTTQASEATAKMVSGLDTPVRAILFYPEVSEVSNQLRPYFEGLAQPNANFSFEIRDHALEPAFARKYRIRDNGHILLLKGLPSGVTITDGKAMAGDGLSSEQFQVGKDIEKARAKLRSLDETFQKRFSKLIRSARSIHFTTGHRERSEEGAEGDPQGERLRGMASLLKRFNIKSSPLGMAQGLAREVPKDAGSVAVIGPREPLLPEEVRALVDYVKFGGRLLIMVDPNVDDGLEPLLNALRLRREKGVVASQRHHMRRRFNDSDKVIVYSNSFTSHPTVSSNSRHSAQLASVFAEATSLQQHSTDAMLKGAKVTFPVRTTADAWVDRNGNFKRDGDERLRIENLTAAVTIGSGDKQGRAVVIGDGGFVSDALIRNNGNILQFVDSVRWLIGEESVSGTLSSEEDVPIEHRKDDDLIWFYATTFGIPIPLLILAWWVRRRRRRDRS